MEDKVLYLIALTVIFLMPGPDMLLLLQTGVRQGVGAALATALGLAMARACHVALAAFGLATMFKILPWTFETVKLAGAAYLLWLGVRMFMPGTADSSSDGPERNASSSWRTAIQRGLLTNLLNPKALLFCSVLLPQFIDPHRASVGVQFAWLGVVLVLMGLLFDSVYATASGWIGRWLSRSRSAQRLQQWLFGSLLIGFALRLALVQQA